MADEFTQRVNLRELSSKNQRKGESIVERRTKDHREVNFYPSGAVITGEMVSRD